MSEDVTDIDAIVASAKNRLRGQNGSRDAGGVLPQMSAREIMGDTPSGVVSRAYDSYEEMDAAQSRRELPAVEENVKTLGDLMARYRIGEDPDFRVLIYRLWPKTFAGGILAEGYYATYDQSITEQTIADEFGGGHYRVAIHGPRPGDTQRTKHYASLVVKIAGEPRTDKIPNKGAGVVPMQGIANAAAPLESESLVNRAFTTLHKFAQDEREERKLLEQQRLAATEASMGTLDTMKSVFETTSRELIESERAAAERERQLLMQQRSSASEVGRETLDTIKSVFERTSRELIEAERAAADRERQLNEERLRDREERLMALERRYEAERRSAPDPMETLQRAATLFRGEGESQQRVFDSVMQKHQMEISVLREENARTIDRIREANLQETAAVREAARREVESERNAAASRERDLLRQIEHEREERRRDADRYRDELASREQAAKDRLDQMKETLTLRFEAQYESFKQQVEMRDKYLQDDLARKSRELDEVKGSVREERDPIAQMRRMNEFRETAKDILGYSGDYSASSGIGSGRSSGVSSSASDSGSGFDLNKVIESVVERGPQYLEAIGRIVQSGGPAGGSAATPPPQPGQILNLPQGTFQVVQTAQGLGMVPYVPPAAVVPERLPPAPRPRGLPPAAPARQVRVMPDVEDMFDEPEQRPAQPQQARPQRPPQQAQPQQAQPQQPARQGRPQRPPQQAQQPAKQGRSPQQAQQARPQRPAPDAAPLPLPSAAAETPSVERLPEAVEKQAAEVIEGLLSGAIMGGDEPEDVIQQISGKFPDEWLKVLAGYDLNVIFSRIREMQPNSAVLTPAGTAFTRDTFKQLRELL